MIGKPVVPDLFGCPICGNEAHVSRQHQDVDRSEGQGIVIECVMGRQTGGHIVKVVGNRFTAATLWNTRAAVSDGGASGR